MTLSVAAHDKLVSQIGNQQDTIREKEKLLSEVRAKNIELERANRKLRAQVDYITSMGYRLPEVLGE